MSESYGVAGSTLKKAHRFFITAASSVGIPMSSLFDKAKAGGANGAPATRRRRSPKSKPQDAVKPPAAAFGASSDGMTTTVDLKSGGQLSISLSLNLFDLSDADREWVWKLIQQVKSYGKEDGDDQEG